MIPGVIPDRQQYDRHTPITSCKPNAAMIPGVNIIFNVFDDFQTTQHPR